MIVVLARANGLRQGGQPPPHPWFERDAWNLTAPSSDAWCAAPAAPPAGQILVLPVRKSPARWEVSCATHPDLAQTLARATLADVMFEIEAGAPEDLDNFVDIVNNSGLKRVGIHAPSQRAARHLRKKSPAWAFAADDAAMLRLHMFASLFLEPVIDFWPDFVLTDASDARALTAREAAELRRRKKRVIWVGAGEPPYPVDGTLR